VLAAAILAAALSVLAYTSMVRPLRALIAAQRRLAGLAERPSGGNELEALKDSLATLERRRNDRDEIGKIFLGRYQVLELIGEGGMGSVFRGWDPKLLRPVALKTIRLSAAISSKDQMATSLIREAVTVARFQHPNIVSVYDVEDSPEAAFVAMEHIDGVSLEQHLRAHPTLPPADAAVLGLALANALAAAHEHDLVHHDVKPGNVLLGFDGSIKMVDFGIARYISSLKAETGQIFGTPGYLPPEALLGEGYDERGDLFALGVILYQTLAGEHPYKGADLKQTCARTMSGQARSLEEICPLTPEPLITAIMSMIASDPERRPQSALVVAATMRDIIREHAYSWAAPSEARKAAGTETEGVLFQSQLLSTMLCSR
jgi:serine/threonine-protein kinase